MIGRQTLVNLAEINAYRKKHKVREFDLQLLED
jgi:hypothetical protein